MFRRVLTPRLSFALALLCSVLGTRAQTTPAAATAPATTTTAPTTAPEPIVANPLYLAWAKYQPGTQVELEMNSQSGGQPMTTQIEMTLTEVTPDQAVVRSVAKVNVPGVPLEEHTQTRTFTARVPQSQAERALLPPSGEGQMTDAGAETIQAAGRAYETQVRAFTGTIQKTPATGKQWRSADVPGGLVKMESNAGSVKVEMVLKSVTVK